MLQETRVALLKRQGYAVASVDSDDAALTVLKTERFDLVVIGRAAVAPVALAQRLREAYPDVLILQVTSGTYSTFASRVSEPAPAAVIHAVSELLA